jgi:hypothetical protein
MVTSVFESDARHPFTGDCGSGLVGMYYFKSQNGTDRTPEEQDLHYQWAKQHGKRRRHRIFYDADHDYTMYMFAMNNPEITYQYPSDLFPLSGSAIGCFGYPGVDLSLPPNFDLELISDLVSQIRGHSFNLGVSIAEGKESLGTIINAATRIRLGLTSLKRGNFSEIPGALGVGLNDPRAGPANQAARRYAQTGNLTGAWLEYQYGWRPLVNDVFEASKALAFENVQPQRKSYRARKHYVHRYDNPNAEFYYWQQVKAVTTKQIIARFTEDPLTTAERLGLTNPALIAWELVPYSFVVDWFAPIGNYLETRSLASSLVGGNFVVSTKIESWFSGLTGGSVNITGGDSMSFHEVRFRREIQGALAVPPPQLDLSGTVTWRRAASALALLNNFNLKF